MEDNPIISRFADMLFDAEKTRIAIEPLTSQINGLTVDDAYAVQMDNVARVVAMGQVISGKKIGLTSPGIQKQMGVNEPDYGHLFASMNCENGKVKTDDLMQPKIEAEIAFVLSKDLTGGHVTAEQVRASTEYVVAAFEVVDSRIADWRIKLVDTIADNASSGRYVLSDKKVSLNDLNLADIKMKMYKNNEMVCEGKGAAVLGDPCEAVAWLANRMWNYGVELKKGEVILSGAFAAAPLASKGDIFTAEFDLLGKVTAEFI